MQVNEMQVGDMLTYADCNMYNWTYTARIEVITRNGFIVKRPWSGNRKEIYRENVIIG